MGEGSLERTPGSGSTEANLLTAYVGVPDRRPGDRSLRVSWHPDTSTVVFSHWVEGLCVASTPVTVRDAATVLRFLAASLPLETATPD